MRLTIKLKLAATFAVVIVLSGVTAWLGIYNMASLDAGLTQLVDGPVKRVEMSLSRKLDLVELVRTEKNLILASTKEETAKFDSDLVKERQSLLSELEASEATASAQGKALWTSARTAVQRLIAVQENIRAAVQKGASDEARSLSSTQSREQVVEAQKALVGVVALNQQRLEAAKADANHQYETSRLLLICIALGSLLIAAGGAVWMALSISRGLTLAGGLAKAVAIGDLTQEAVVKNNDEIKDLIDALNQMTTNLRTTAGVADTIANGDLTVKVKRFSDKDTLGIALERMVEKLGQVMQEALRASDNVSSGSVELSSSADQLSQGATEQASATDEVSSSMEQMAASIKQNADNAAQTEKIAGQSASDARASGEAVARAVEAMQIIAGKITIVQEIARQTDLLALNAAVEAARAGQHGKGFAVVASEVRKLAERSQTAAAEISEMSATTVKAAEAAGEMLTRLVPDIQKTAELVTEISAASREQEIGAEQINKAIQQLDQVTQQNASASEQMSATSEELSAQAEQLQSGIAYFHIEGTGPVEKAPATAAAKQPATAKTSSRGADRVAPVAKSAPNGAAKLIAKVQSAYGSGKADRKTGVKLDLGPSGPDHQDSEFERAG